jgi:hypothetical protein
MPAWPSWGIFSINRATTIALAAKYRVPAIYFNRVFVANGGLMSYGPDSRRPLYDAAAAQNLKPPALPGDIYPVAWQIDVNPRRRTRPRQNDDDHFAVLADGGLRGTAGWRQPAHAPPAKTPAGA